MSNIIFPKNDHDSVVYSVASICIQNFIKVGHIDQILAVSLDSSLKIIFTSVVTKLTNNSEF